MTHSMCPNHKLCVDSHKAEVSLTRCENLKSDQALEKRVKTSDDGKFVDLLRESEPIWNLKPRAKE